MDIPEVALIIVSPLSFYSVHLFYFSLYCPLV